MPLCKQHIFQMPPCLILSNEKINHKPNMYGKFQRFNAIDGSIKMLKEGWISKNFNKNE